MRLNVSFIHCLVLRALLACAIAIGCAAHAADADVSPRQPRNPSEAGGLMTLLTGHAREAPAAAAPLSSKSSGEKELEASSQIDSRSHAVPGPDDWRVITDSLALFRHLPYMVDLILGLFVSVFSALVLTATPRRAKRFDPVATAETRRATVIVALIGCIAADLVQESQQFFLGAEIALVLFGIGGLVRFRTVFGDARQTGMAIVATVLGLMAGMSQYSLVVVSVAVIFIVNWWLSSKAFVRVSARIGKNADMAQVQAAIDQVLHNEGFTLVRTTARSAKRFIEIHAQTGRTFDIDALAASIEKAVPAARIRVTAS